MKTGNWSVSYMDPYDALTWFMINEVNRGMGRPSHVTILGYILI